MNQSSSHILLTSKINRERKKYILFHSNIKSGPFPPYLFIRTWNIIKPKLLYMFI